MKTAHWFGLILILILVSCKKDNPWKEIQLNESLPELNFTDISSEFFNTDIPIETLLQKYPFFFQEGKENEVWEEQRRDSIEIAVYEDVSRVFGDNKYKTELQTMFGYFKFHFPNELIPDIYTYSSALQNIGEDAVLYGRHEGMMFIALDGFLGEDSKWYEMMKIYPYMSQNMNPENLLPSVVYAIGEQIVPFNPRQQTFIDLMVDEGKKLIIADALLPDTSDEVKIGFTKEQLEWAIENEAEIWNYFVEQNLIFDADKSNRERFIQPGPYSKFLNEIETESPGRIGVWIGWQICRKYLSENSKISLTDLINTDNQQLFKESKYKPKK